MNEHEFAAYAASLGCEVHKDEPLCRHTTFRIGGPCLYMIQPDSVDTLAKLVSEASRSSIRTLLIGKGSNMLCDDSGFEGVVILLNGNFSEITYLGGGVVRAQSGASLMSLCRFAQENSLTGLEFAYGIPGTVGGGIYMNAGAYGGEMSDVLESVTAMDKNGRLHTYPAERLELTYRSSRFCHSDEIIVSGDFRLEKGDSERILERMAELMSRRKDKQPLEYPNAGSTFKRPEGQFAGKLIEDSGLRGMQIGGAQVSQKHCGFVINKDNATSQDVKQLIEHIKKTVYEKTGFMLECEVRIIPYREDKGAL